MVCITFVSQISLYLFCLYLLSLHFIVAWYKILDAKHNPFNGQSSLTRQFHNFCGSAGLGCSVFFVVTVYFWSDVSHARTTKFYCVFGEDLWFCGTYLLINILNILPILVLTDLLYGGLKQMMLRFFLFVLIVFFWLFSLHCLLGIFHSK